MFSVLFLNKKYSCRPWVQCQCDVATVNGDGSCVPQGHTGEAGPMQNPLLKSGPDYSISGCGRAVSHTLPQVIFMWVRAGIITDSEHPCPFVFVFLEEKTGRHLKWNLFYRQEGSQGQKWMQGDSAEISFMGAWSPRSCGLFIAREPGKLVDSGPSSFPSPAQALSHLSSAGGFMEGLYIVWETSPTCGRDPYEMSSHLEIVLCLFQECLFHFLFFF